MPTDEESRYERVPIPEESTAERLNTFGELLHPYTLEEATLEAQRCLQCEMPFCVQACPIAQDCRGYIHALALGDPDGAAAITLRQNPLATTLCKTCYHFCEDACVMKDRGAPIAIRHLKRAAVELGASNRLYVPSAPVGQRIAIVGTGPAGLMAAWELCLRGYAVTIFDEEPYLGGQVVTIPKYHLDGNEVEIDVARFRRFDLTFRMGTKIGRDLGVAALLASGYRAVYLAIGSSNPRSLGLPGESLPGVVPAIDLLREVNEGPPAALGQRIVVIGGGDVAMDAIRSARRLAPGASVTVVYHRSEAEMPAGEEERDGAKAEGVAFDFERAPMRIVGATHVEGLEVRRTAPGPPAPSGRPTTTSVPGSEETIACDTVLLAIGEVPDLSGFPPELDLGRGPGGWPQGQQPDTMTGLAGVFASGGRSIVHAMAAGTRSAEAIDAYVRRASGLAPLPRPDPLGEGVPFRRPSGYGGPTWTP